MGYYDNGFSFLKEFPLSIVKEIFMDNPKTADLKTRYANAMARYKTEYAKALSMGITREQLATLGIENPNYELLAAGGGFGNGGGAGGGFFPTIPILVPSTTERIPTEGKILQVETKIRVIIDKEEQKRRPTPPTPSEPEDTSNLDDIFKKYGDHLDDISNEDWTRFKKY